MVTQSALFQPIESSRLSDAAVRQIKALIEQGVLKPGDKLPSERKLVEQLSVSRASIREALRVLEALELIDVQSGLGAFVADKSIGRDLPSKWIAWLVEHHEKVADLLEIREALEPKAAALAAERISDEEIEKITQVLSDMKKSAGDADVELAVQTDIEFHDLISRATRNEFLIKLNDSINHVLLESRYAYYQDPNRILASWKEHQRVMEKIESHDPAAAAAAMLRHVQDTKKRMQQIVVD